MNKFLTLRMFCAAFLSLFGLGLIFVRAADMQLLIGALVAAVGITFFIQVALVVRRG